MSSSSVQIVDVDWLMAHQADPATIIVDVRPYSQYQLAHIPGAISLDVAALRLPASDDQTIAAWTRHLQKGLRAAGISAESQVVFYEDISGTLAAFGVWLLDVAGLRNGALLDGGLRAWQAAGQPQPLSSEPETPQPGTVEISIDRTVLATADGILKGLNADPSSTQIVDTRGVVEHRSGTIPGSINVEWTQHLDLATGKLKSHDDLQALYSAAGVTSEQPAVTYCAAGFRAAHTYVILRSIGFQDVRSYAPSWAEWAQRPDTPVESAKPQPSGE